ncbi:MAG: hypothetical protein BWY26_01026 [Elusimicrobia bacterium ADurb.Bin231]|nr:MAG: hypothetical protein BWY26_01026 [Elusimicrobia bacterium ADurb.Bin231]
MAEQEKIDTHFLSLLYTLSSAAMQQLGKTANPLNQKIEKNLEQARVSIDILEMLNEKTSGNLTPDEEKLLSSMLANLQLNYVYELEKEGKKQDLSN